MNPPGTPSQPPQNKPFMIPGPYSSSGQFSPGIANILESGRLRQLRERQDAIDAQNRQAAEELWQWQQSQGQQHQPEQQSFTQTASPVRKRGFLARLFFGLLTLVKWAVIVFVVIVVLAAVFG